MFSRKWYLLPICFLVCTMKFSVSVSDEIADVPGALIAKPAETIKIRTHTSDCFGISDKECCSKFTDKDCFFLIDAICAPSETVQDSYVCDCVFEKEDENTNIETSCSPQTTTESFESFLNDTLDAENVMSA